MNDTNQASTQPAGGPRVVARNDHPISRANISSNALKVLYRLRDSGFQAFLVGGAVRDLLLDLHPKDFDIATNAHPDEVKQLFRNCRLIGRRFHLAHVRFGYEIIEVATFRAAHTSIDEDNSVDEGGRVLDERGRILRDNLYGTIEEDVWRRDFTANALYYNIEDFSVWDYVGGVEDARNRILRMIGDPETRYREDPVRMLRAVRFAAKLGFTIHDATAAPIPKLAWMLDGVPPARLFDEVNKIFLAGSAQPAFELLERLQLLEHLFPDLASALQDAPPESPARQLVRLGLQGTDERVRSEKSVTPTFLFAILMWPAVLRAFAKHGHASDGDPQHLLEACDQVTARQQQRVAIPKRFTLPLRELVGLQPRFERREGRRALRLLNHPRFRAAYDFLVLRAAAGEADPELAQWWTDIQSASADERIARVENAAPGERAASDGPRRRRRRRRRRPPAAS